LSPGHHRDPVPRLGKRLSDAVSHRPRTYDGNLLDILLHSTPPVFENFNILENY
jgi:hypothetical protein